MHYPKWAFARNLNACIGGDDLGCTILPRSGSGINKDLMGESTKLTSRDASGVFGYYYNESPCYGVGTPLCTWKGPNPVTTTSPATYSFTLTQTDAKSVIAQGNQMPIKVSLQRRNADGTYTTIVSKTGTTDTSLVVGSSDLQPGTYRWHIIATSGSGSVDLFFKG
jgi:hypothetical protein